MKDIVNQLSSREKKLLYFLVCFLLIIGGWYFIISPALDKHTALNNEYQSLLMQNSSKQIELQRYLSAPEELKEKQDSLNKIIKKYNPILKDEKIDKLITTLILNNGLDPISLTIGDIQDVQLQQDNTNETNNSKETVSTVNEETSLVALRVAADEELLTKLTNLQNTITDKEKTVIEKNNAYEELMTLNENKGLEENIESKLKEKFSYDSFVKINKDQINIVISSTKHDKMIANSIIKEVQSMFDTKKYITVKFQ